MNKEIYWIENKGCQTLMYYINQTFPAKHGNTISYGNRKLCNLNAENLDYLLENKIVEFPIKCEIVDNQTLLCVDDRIPSEFLIDTREEERKWREEQTHTFSVSSGDSILCGYKGKDLWTEGIVYAPFYFYIPKLED
jgi:hypothetical protein